MLRKILSLTLSISLLFQYSGFAQSINLSDYLSRTPNTVALDRFRPLSLRYFSYEPSVDNFKILLDKGDQKDLSDIKIKDEADRLLTYFKIGLSLPNEKFWVNLRPDAEDQIIDPELEKTDLGKVLLEADLQLKKDTSSLTSPQSKEGKVYWEKLYKKAGELFGTENITIPTITRPWIVPGEIIVRESKDSAYIYKAVLKVMLEEDYLSFQPSAISSQQYVFSDPRLKELNKYSTELIKETILPELTKRINSSKDYASLRQVFFSLILARWFKDKYQGYSVGNGLKPFPTVDSGDLTGLTSKESWSKTVYFNEYKKSFNDGEYNLSEKVHTPGGQAIRRYTSGGMRDLMTGEMHSYNPGTANSSIVTLGNGNKVFLNIGAGQLNIQKTAASAIEIEPEIAFDSRGKKTVAVTLKIGNIEARGDVPAGASKGEDEATTVGAENAIKNIKDIIVPLILEEVGKGRDLGKHADLLAIEKMIIAKAGDNYAVLGADAVVPVSRALWVLAAKLHNMELWQYIRKFEPEAVFDNPNIVFPYMNIYNGGLHAIKGEEKLGKDRIDFQEIMIAPVGAKSQEEALAMGDRIDFELKKILLETFKDKNRITRADEAGFSVKGLGSSDEAIEYVFKAIKKAGYNPGFDVKLALDTAATSFYNKDANKYAFQGDMLSSDEMINYYVNLARKYEGKIVSIEDGLAENDWEGWTKLTQAMEKFGTETVGDDLFVSQLKRLEKGIKVKAAKAILIKVNQNGSMSGTLDVIKRAKKAGFLCIVSHRSGETMDTTIADLAYGVKAFGLKTGDPQPDYDFGPGGEYADRALVRRVKYKRMVENEDNELKITSSALENQMVYFFGGKEAEGVNLIEKKQRKILLGGKGAGMQEMYAMGIPVPPGYTITTTAGVHFLKQGSYPEGLKNEIENNLAKLEALMGKKLGDPNDPLLVSVRSGARDSMPGMMDTVLNLGLTPKSVEGLARKTNNPRFAYDAYRRFIEGFGKIVLGVVNANEGEEDMFLAIFNQIKQEEGIKAVAETDAEVSAEALINKVIPRYMKLVREKTGQEFPIDPKIQLELAIKAVFNSWNAQRAKDYREVHNIPVDWGTACNIVAMVFGNTGNNSGTGVYFTRDNTTGENKPYGNFLVNAQGDDVVSGNYPVLKINEVKNKFPEIYAQLLEIGEKLENVEKEMQDIEFTIQDGKLYILQKRTGKRTGQAAIKIAVDMAKEGLITKEEAISRVSSLDLAQLLYPRLDPKAKVDTLVKGVAGSLGVASGKIVFNTESVLDYKKKGEKTILVRKTTSPEDFKGMVNAAGILTKTGGETSHAAIVCKSERKIGVFGAEDLVIDYKTKTIKVGNRTQEEGDVITVDANSKKVYAGEAPLIPGGLTAEAKELLSWADSIRRLDIRANADTWEQAEKAREFGAKGIGLLRIEHWIQVNEELQELFQLWTISDDKETKKEVLSKIETLLKPDMKKILKIMDGYPVIVRTVDPPLHEFMPEDKDKIQALADKLRISFEQTHPSAKRSWFIDKLIKLRLLRDPYVKQVEAKIESLKELNPMLGHRGVRLGITDPEITEMQTRAIISAGCELVIAGIKAIPEIMIPVVAIEKELKDQEKIVKETARKVMESYGVSQEELPWKFGTMIELPSAARSAKELAGIAEFVSFGTNDLTQTTLGLSRDDSGKFLDVYASKGIMPENPFVTLHHKVYGLMEEAVINARKVNKDLEIGICGEHGRDPKSIEIADKIGLDYVSPSGDGILIARLVAAQSELKLRAEREKLGPAPLTIDKLKTAIEKMQSENYTLSLKNQPELGGEIKISETQEPWDVDIKFVIQFGDRVTAQDIKNYILKRPEAQKMQGLLGNEIIKAITEAEGKASSAMVNEAQVSPDLIQAKVVGGIDFRQMNMLIQPQGGFASSSLDFSLPELSKAEIEAFDLDKELEFIQRMASSGIDPIDERLKKYLAVCFARGKTGKEIDDLKLCLEDVFIAQQLDARQTPDGYKEVIVIADTRRFVLKESRLAASGNSRVNLN